MIVLEGVCARCRRVSDVGADGCSGRNCHLNRRITRDQVVSDQVSASQRIEQNAVDVAAVDVAADAVVFDDIVAAGERKPNTEVVRGSEGAPDSYRSVTVEMVAADGVAMTVNQTISAAGSRAGRAGISNGDVLTEVVLVRCVQENAAEAVVVGGNVLDDPVFGLEHEDAVPAKRFYRSSNQAWLPISGKCRARAPWFVSHLSHVERC